MGSRVFRDIVRGEVLIFYNKHLLCTLGNNAVNNTVNGFKGFQGHCTWRGSDFS